MKSEDFEKITLESRLPSARTNSRKEGFFRRQGRRIKKAYKVGLLLLLPTAFGAGYTCGAGEQRYQPKNWRTQTALHLYEALPGSSGKKKQYLKKESRDRSGAYDYFKRSGKRKTDNNSL